MEEKTGIQLLLGKIITGITGKKGDNELIFKCNDGTKYQMYHDRDCCEQVWLEDVIGNFEDLLNSPVLKAEEVTHKQETPSEVIGKQINEYDDSFTWTFYHISTIKGTVTLRWYGSSNGYYSESVDFIEI
jgi:hypothetical protein